jgi:hypothetical protein
MLRESHFQLSQEGSTAIQAREIETARRKIQASVLALRVRTGAALAGSLFVLPLWHDIIKLYLARLAGLNIPKLATQPTQQAH